MDELNEKILADETQNEEITEEKTEAQRNFSFSEEKNEPENEINKESDEKCDAKKLSKKELSASGLASFVLACASHIFLAGIPLLGVVFSVVCAILAICLGSPLKKEKNQLAGAAFIIAVVALVLSAFAAVISLVLGNGLINAIVYFINQNSSPFGFGSPFFMFP